MNEVRTSGCRATAAMACLLAILACAESCGSAGEPIGCPTGRVTLGDSCVSPAGTAHVPETSTATGAVVIDLGDTGARLIVPPGASSAPLDVQWSVRALAAVEQAADGQTLLPQEIELGPSGTVFNSPLVLELPMSWPPGYDAMTTGVRVVWAPAYARSSGVLGRDTLRSIDADEGGTGWVILDATKSPRKATALALLDHFSSHTLVIPSPSLEFDGQAAFTSQTVNGSTVPLTVPTGLFAHGMFDIFALDDPQKRRELYAVELTELARQTVPAQAALSRGYDSVFANVLGLTGQASPAKQLYKLAAGLQYQTALKASGAAVARAERLSSGFLRLANSMANVEKLGTQVQIAQCLTDGALQLWVLTTLDDELVAARWAAIKSKLLGSPLGQGDTALQGAISDVDFALSAAAGDQFLQSVVEYLDKAGASLAVPTCVDFVKGAVSGIIAKAVVKSLLADAVAAAKAGITTTLSAGVAVALASALIEDWVTKDVFKAAQNGERLAILASLLKDGTLGAFPDLGSKITVDASGLAKVSLPDVLDYTDAASAPYLRLQAAVYAQSTIFATISSVVKRDDMSHLTQFFDNWKNVWCTASSTCPSGWGIDLLAGSFDQASWSNENARQSLVTTFAACAVPGACVSTCSSPNNDGYGVGLACVGPAASPGGGPSCSDGKKNQDETGVDCGGVCAACSANSCPSGNGFYCGKAALSQNPQYLYVCQDGDYSFSSTCNGQGCQVSAPGVDDACATKAATCSDGLQNQGETGVDCGGPCQACPMMMGCSDGVCNGGETCSSCPQDCDACPPTCPDGQCNGGESCATCPQDCGACACGGSGQACCAGNSCTSPYQCSGGTCGCGAGNNGQFIVTDHVYPSFGAPGCSGDNTLKLKASAAMVSPTVLRVYVRKADDTAFTSGGTLSLYVGSGPTCPNPPNVVKTTKAVVNGVQEQTIDLSVNPYTGAWNLNEAKTFWVGKDEGGFQSWRASGYFSVDRICM